jgi:hypothetical protein
VKTFAESPFTPNSTRKNSKNISLAKIGLVVYTIGQVYIPRKQTKGAQG